VGGRWVIGSVRLGVIGPGDAVGAMALMQDSNLRLEGSKHQRTVSRWLAPSRETRSGSGMQGLEAPGA
jgi:hypothetical protein